MKNLNQAPTREELEEIGFEYDEDKQFILNNGAMILIAHINEERFDICQKLVDGRLIYIRLKPLTKDRINNAYELFGLEPPFEMVEMPKVGEVWSNHAGDAQVIKVTNDSITIQALKVNSEHIGTPIYGLEYNELSKFLKLFTKTHDTIEEYFAEKNKKTPFSKESIGCYAIQKMVFRIGKGEECRQWIADYINGEILNQ